MPSPSRRIFAGAIAARASPVEHPLNAAAHAASRFVLRSPDRFEYLDDQPYWGFLGLAFMLPFLVWRLLDEERLLGRELWGYAAYQARVRYRLIPGLW